MIIIYTIIFLKLTHFFCSLGLKDEKIKMESFSAKVFRLKFISLLYKYIWHKFWGKANILI